MPVHTWLLGFAQSSSEVTVALITLETTLKAANIQSMPTPRTTEGIPPSAAMAALGVRRMAVGTAVAAVAIASGAPRRGEETLMKAL